MRVRPSVLRVILAVLVLTEVAVGPAVAGQFATGGSGPAASLQGTGSVDDLRERVRTERAVLDDLLAEMIEEDRLYARLTGRQVDRAVLRAEDGELVSGERADISALETYYYPAQDKPDRLADLAYDVQQSVENVDELRAAVDEERRVVDQLRGRIGAENTTLARLQTPLSTSLEAQRETQLDGLALLNETLVEHDERLGEVREFQASRAEYARFYSEIWRETETVERKRVLANISADFERASEARALGDSRFESQRLGVALLWEHHRARMETVEQYRALLTALEGELEALGDDPSPTEVERLRARLDERTTEVATVRALLVNESSVAGRLRAEVAVQERLYEERTILLEEQRLLLRSAVTETRPARLRRVLGTLDETVDRESDTLAALHDQVGVQEGLVDRLYGAGSDLEVDQRLLAYLRVRDRIADFMLANLETQERSLEAQQGDLRSKGRAVARLQAARGVQDHRRQLPWVIETFEDSQTDAAVLRERFENQREVLGWLTRLRTEADLTLETEEALLDSLDSDLERVTAGSSVARPTETVSRTAAATTTRAVGAPAASSSTESPWSAGLLLAALFTLSVGLLLWLGNPSVPEGISVAAGRVRRIVTARWRASAETRARFGDGWRTFLASRPGAARAWQRLVTARDGAVAWWRGGGDDERVGERVEDTADPDE